MTQPLPPLTPRVSDGKPLSLPSIFPFEMLLNFAGRPDTSEQRYGGAIFGLSKSGVGSSYKDFQFQDGVFLTGGNVMWVGGGYGSYVSMDIYAPATQVVDPETPGTGNCNLAPTGLGFNIIVPAAGDGAKNLGAVVSPVTAERDEDMSPHGFWDYDDPWIGYGEVSPGIPNGSKYNLFDAQVHLGHFCDIHLVLPEGVREAVLHSIKPKWILPQWFTRVTINNAHSGNTLQVGWDLVIARKKSV